MQLLNEAGGVNFPTLDEGSIIHSNAACATSHGNGDCTACRLWASWLARVLVTPATLPETAGMDSALLYSLADCGVQYEVKASPWAPTKVAAARLEAAEVSAMVKRKRNCSNTACGRRKQLGRLL